MIFLREAEEDKENEPIDPHLKHALDTYEKNSCIINEFGNIIDPTDTLKSQNT